MNKKHLIVSIAILFVGLSGCEKNNLKPYIDHSSKYLPLDVGYAWTYAVDSVAFYGDAILPQDTFRYQIRHTILHKDLDSSGLGTYSYLREYRINDSSSWQFQRNFSEIINKTGGVRKEADLMRIFIQLPILEYDEWDSNLYNTKDEDYSFYESVHQPFTIGATNYDSTIAIKLEQKDYSTEREYTRMRYAANIGLVIYEYEDLLGLSPLSMENAYGTSYRMQLLKFEKK